MKRFAVLMTIILIAALLLAGCGGGGGGGADAQVAANLCLRGGLDENPNNPACQYFSALVSAEKAATALAVARPTYWAYIKALTPTVTPTPTGGKK